jgi:hypothetical protein
MIMAYTRFLDMRSGGRCKIPPYEYIYIEASEEIAIAVFKVKLGRKPNNVSCDTCGEDYSISEANTLEELTGYDRGCRYVASKKVDGKYVDPPVQYVEEGESAPEGFTLTKKERWAKTYIPLKEYLKSENVLVIRTSEF